MSIENLVEDKRPIKAIYYEQNGGYTVGACKITKIEPYYEYGEMAGVPWFNVYSGEKVISRVNAKYISCVEYFEEELANV